MSGSEFERENIVTDALSAAPASKPAEPPREHTFRPPAEGLYDLSLEKDSCGVGFIANIKGKKSRQIVSDAISILCNLEHRGAVGADPRAGDGAGILVQIPHSFFARKAAEIGFQLPEPGEYAIGALFMPRETAWRNVIKSIVADQIKAEGLMLLGWREVPTDNSSLGETVKPTEPSHMQVFIARNGAAKTDDDFERRLYILRKSISQAIYQRRDRGLAGYYPVSMSCRTVIYKGMFLADQLGKYYPDLHEPDFESALALVHQRFSTNTFPTWSLAHPYRMIAHNGEINTLRGNVNWMAARQASVSSDLYGKDISRLWPISYEGQSDTACFDNALEFLVQGGYSLPHAVMMMIPEAWTGNPLMDEQRRAFYEYHAALMEPWDGPAAIAFTDGRQIGATLDRNGLRPARYLVTRDDRIVMASEMGVLKIPEDEIITKWRLQPGKMLLVDLEQGRLIPDDEIKASLAKSHPYREWLDRTQIVLEELPGAPTKGMRSNLPLLDRQQAFGYSQEDINILMTPMAATGEEAAGSMGNDTPISALSDRPKQLFTYFKQNFAQVTNPPIDPIREELVMSLVSIIGPRPNLFDLQGLAATKRLEVRQPILTDADLEKIRSISDLADTHFKSRTLDTTFHAGFGAAGLEPVLDELCARAEAAVREGVNIIILSDRMAGSDRIPIPSLLACAAVHHHLIRVGLRTSVGLVVESGEPREVHHFACLAGYGAEAINPYLAFETIIAMKDRLPGALDDYEIVKRYIKSIGKGLLKVMSKMGISTYQSYCGAQIFDAVGLKADFVSKYFVGTHTRIEGVGLAEIAEETARRHADAFGDAPVYKSALDVGGEYAYRTRGEDHAWTAEFGIHAAARRARQFAGALPGVCQDPQRAVRAAVDLARPVQDQGSRGREAQARAARRSRARQGHRKTLRHRSDVVRLDFARGAHHACDRHEPDRRQVQHRRRRRGKRSLQADGEWRFDALGDQAGRLRPLRRHHGISCQFRHDADQDGAGREARRRRTTARPQGRRHHCAGAAFDTRRRPDLAAAASRHLFDRGSGAADLRSQERQSGRPGFGQARLRNRRRHGRRRRRQGPRRSCHHRRLRGRHRRFAADFDQACRQPLGNRPCRNPPDPGARTAAQPHRGPGRWRLPHRARRGDRRAARGRRIRFRHRAPDRGRLHHDAQVPSQHLPGRGRDPGSAAAQAFHRSARACHQLFLLRRRGSPRDHGRARLPDLQRDDRPDPDARPVDAGGALEGQGARLLETVRPPEGTARPEDLSCRRPEPSSRSRAGPPADRKGQGGARPRRAGEDRRGDQQHQPQRRRDAVRRGGEDLRPCRPAARYHPGQLQGHRGTGVRRLACARRHLRSGRRRQRLCRQGPVRRPHHRQAAAQFRHRAGGIRSWSATP